MPDVLDYMHAQGARFQGGYRPAPPHDPQAVPWNALTITWPGYQPDEIARMAREVRRRIRRWREARAMEQES
jgi:hypothetical protein